MNNIKLWPHLTMVAVVCAVLAGSGVALWMKHEQTVEAESLPSAARIQRVDGDVAFSSATGDPQATTAGGDQWIAASPNQPFSVGDRIYTRDNSRASVAFTGRNFARLNPNTSLDVLSLANRRTQLALRDGSAMFDVGYLAPGELFEVATPYGAVDLDQPGLYDVGIDRGNVVVSVLSGLAQVVGLGGGGHISKGEMLTLLGQTAADVVLSRLAPRDAGYLVDDYYGYQYPQYYDGRYSDYNNYLNDPNYFDPYRRNISYQYVNGYIPGINDLDYYGDWQNLNDYGYAWSPRVDAGWSPYEEGHWMTDYPYGPTWVSSEPWGYAPYHYGRWTNVGNRWYWIPDSVNTTPTYSPAMVAFLPLTQNEVGWVPLGPGDAYAPHYYNNDWQPRYLSRPNVQERMANLNIPGAVTYVPIEDFSRDFDWKRARKADRSMLAQARPVLDPLMLTPLRNAVVHSAWGRGKKDLPPGIARKLRETSVITSSAPLARFHRDFAKDMRVEAVPQKVKNQKFKIKDERGADGQNNVGNFGARQQQNPVQGFEGRGNRGTRQDFRRAEAEQRDKARMENSMREAQSQRAAQFARQQQAQGERVGRHAKQELRKDEVSQPKFPRDRGPEIREARPPLPIHKAQEQQMRQSPPVATGQGGGPGRGQGRSQEKAERKQDRVDSAQPSHGNGGGKGKGKKP